MASLRSLGYKSYLSNADVNVPKETKRRRRRANEVDSVLVQGTNDASQSVESDEDELCYADCMEEIVEDVYDSESTTFDDYYVPDGDNTVFSGSSITRGQLFTLVYAFILRHCCTELAVQDLLCLFNALIPGCLPHNLYFFRKFLNRGIADKVETHLLCTKCGAYLCKNEDSVNNVVCYQCNSSLNCTEVVKQNSTFLLWPISEQLKFLLEKVGIGSVVNNVSSNNTINDICDGSQYRKLSIRFPDSLSLTCNTDGIPLFSSSNSSLWPIYFVINELPLKLRAVHMMLAGLWMGTSKPRIDAFFKPIVDSLENLHDVGVTWIRNGKQITTKVFLCVVSCDSVARPLLQNTKQFNGEYGCSFCLSSGSIVPKGHGFCRSYAHCGDDLPDLRTHEQMLEHAHDAVDNGCAVFGIKGPSILAMVPDFNLVLGFVPEYMHCLLLGVVRQFVSLWFDTTSSNQPYYLGRHVNVIDSAMANIQPPSNVKRLPRSISTRKYWKASEWRNFLLFYSPVLLKSVLAKEFFHHWCLLIYSVFQLIITPITEASISLADVALHKFVCLVPELYGAEHVSFNVHLLTHLAQGVEHWGPLWSHSAFFFEDANGKLLKFFHGSRGVTAQIFRSFVGVSHLRVLSEMYIDKSSAAVLDELVNMASFCKNSLKIEPNVVCLGNFTKRVLRAAEVIAISALLNSSHLASSDITEYNRVVVNGMLLNTYTYSDCFRRRDCYFKSKSLKIFVLVNCVICNVCALDDCRGEHETFTKLILLAHPVHDSVIQVFDSDVNANLFVNIKKAIINEDSVVALFASDVHQKSFVLSDAAHNLYVIPVPTFELD